MKLFIELFISFFKIGAFTFGGGLAMIPLIEKEVVEKKHWITKEEFIDIIALSQTVPGAMSINASIFIGYKLKKLPGAITAMLGTAVPSFFIILIVATFFTAFDEIKIIQKAFLGIRPAVAALIGIAIFSIGKNIPKTFKNILFILISCILLLFFDFNPIFIILMGALLGIFSKEELKNDSH